MSRSIARPELGSTSIPRPTAIRWLLTRGALFVALAAGALVGTIRLSGLVADDAFIYYRYARNLAHGLGWVYNPGGPAANAATSPPYVLLLAAASLAVPDVHLAATALFVLALAACALLSFEVFALRGDPLGGGLAAAFVALSPWLLLTRGMETALFLCLVALCLCLFVIWLDRTRAGSASAAVEVTLGAALAVLTVTRGEGIILAATLTIAQVLTRRRIAWRTVLACATVGGLWGIYSLVALGGIVPGTLQAKMAQGASGFWGTGRVFFSGFVSIVDVSGFWSWLDAVVVLAVAGLVSLAVESRHRAALLTLAAFAVVFCLVYGFALNVPGYHWYYGLPVYSLHLLAAAGASAAIRAGWRRRQILVAAGPAGISALALLLGFAAIQHGFSYVGYVETGEWLRSQTPPGARIAAAEIGVLGWYSERPIEDYLGLLSPESAAEVRRADLVSWVYRTPPDYWIAHDPIWGFEAPLASEPWFRFAFRRVYASHGVIVYQRVDGIDDARARAAAAPPRLGASATRLLTERGIALANGVGEASVTAALEAVLRVYLIRHDLQVAYGDPARLNLTSLVHWAAIAGLGPDSSRAVFAPHAAALREIDRAMAEAPPVGIKLDLAAADQ